MKVTCRNAKHFYCNQPQADKFSNKILVCIRQETPENLIQASIIEKSVNIPTISPFTWTCKMELTTYVNNPLFWN